MIATETTSQAANAQEIFEKLAGALQDHLHIDGNVDEAKVREIAEQVVAEAKMPQPLEIHLGSKVIPLQDRTHCQFKQLLELVSEGHKNLMMVGPAGTGKTTMATKHLAKALGLDHAFISLSAGVTETHIFGRMLPKADGTWGYVESAFVRIYRNGGVFLFDEVDAADANVMVSVNAALANGELANPVTGEVIKRHADCIIIAAANTYGRGGDMMYVGRNALDAATLDRFVLSTLFVDYDTALELDIMKASLSDGQVEELIAWVSDLRDKIANNRLRRVASTRLVEQSVKAMASGKGLDDVKARYFQNWSKDELAKVRY